MNKKGQIMDSIGKLGVGVATLTIVMVVAFLMIANTIPQIESNTGNACNTTNAADLACNATVTLRGAAATVPGWIPLVVLVAIGGIILSMVKLFRR